MKKNERRIFIKSRESVARWNRAAKRLANCGARAFSELKVAVNCMPAAVDLRDAIIEPARSFARIAHSVDFLCAADFCDERAAQQSLEIERKIGPNLPGFRQPRQQTLWRAEAAEFAAGEEVDVIHIGISAEQRRKLRIYDPGNLGTRIRFTKQPDCRQRVDDVAERTRLND